MNISYWHEVTVWLIMVVLVMINRHHVTHVGCLGISIETTISSFGTFFGRFLKFIRLPGSKWLVLHVLGFERRLLELPLT